MTEVAIPATYNYGRFEHYLSVYVTIKAVSIFKIVEEREREGIHLAGAAETLISYSERYRSLGATA